VLQVSTAEVAAAIGALPSLKLQHCLVYGVKVPYVDGRVGMAAILPEANAPPPSMRDLYEGLEAQLPSYAQPRFIRLLRSADAIELTLTFKPKRQQLVADGFEHAESGEVYLRCERERSFVRMDEAARKGLLDGTSSVRRVSGW